MKMVNAYEKDTLLRDDPFFKEFRGFEPRSNKNFWCGRIENALNRKSEKFWYPLGFAYALILDDIAPGWKKEIFASPKFFDGIFEKSKFVY